MLRSNCLSLIVLSILTMTAVAQESQAITEAESVIAIYTSDWALGSSEGTRLIVCIWSDGSIVWSNNSVNGGPPYLTANLNPQHVADTFKKITEVGVFDVPRLKQANFGPDSKFTTILVRNGGNELKMDSWHELYESNGKVVAGDHGLNGLDGRKLLPALAEQPADYLHYRMTWLELRLAAAKLIPTSGTDTAGMPTMVGGKLSWKHEDNK